MFIRQMMQHCHNQNKIKGQIRKIKLCCVHYTEIAFFYFLCVLNIFWGYIYANIGLGLKTLIEFASSATNVKHFQIFFLTQSRLNNFFLFFKIQFNNFSYYCKSSRMLG